MRRYFNTEGLCRPDVHYMVDLGDRLKEIKERYVERGSYFMIDRARQYGKTTTLQALAGYLRDQYVVLYMDLQKMGAEDFADEKAFSRAFVKSLSAAFKTAGTWAGERKGALQELLYAQSGLSLSDLFILLSRLCGETARPIVLLIDEVDSASNDQVFLDLLAQLRAYYLDRENSPIFQSVILAGVYDIKNLRLKIRPEKEHRYNSPWNIAARFNMEMSFSAKQIGAMLQGYEDDCHTGMDVEAVAGEIYRYTFGYPYLVSAICKLLDEELSGNRCPKDTLAAWSERGIAAAVDILLRERSPLFDSMIRQLTEHPDMKRMLQAILFQGKRVTYNPDNPAIELAAMFGYISSKAASVQVANRIFEMRLYNYFLSEEELDSLLYDQAQGDRGRFIVDGRLDMDLVLERFAACFHDIYGKDEDKFVEAHGRKFFLLYLKPIINGTGNYYIEAQTRDARRTDVIVDYLGEQFIIELKIWRGNEYNERGEEQLAGYLDRYHLKKGYMISFNFNKNKEPGVKEVRLGDRVIVEAIV